MVNLINHSPTRSNVRLQWSQNNPQQQHQEQLTLEQLQEINTKPTASAAGLLLELVTTEDIKEGEEVLLDYGLEWQAAWEKHMHTWEPYQFDYAPAYVFDEAVPVLNTQDENQESQQPYPPNLVTSCFYPYQHRSPPPPKAEKEGDTHDNNNPNQNRNITSAEWQHVPGIFELRHLRPCTIMQRFEVESSGTDEDTEGGGEAQKEKETNPSNFYYTVVIRNRYGLAPPERIPPGHMHVVTRVPRRAIRFTDKIYTTDQHLQGAFRKEIGLGDDVFPKEWMNLKKSEEESATVAGLAA